MGKAKLICNLSHMCNLVWIVIICHFYFFYRLALLQGEHGWEQIVTSAKMSGNANSKKLAKRSIVGTRIVVPSSNHDGRLLPGVIVAMKTPGSDSGSGGNSSVEPLGPPRPRLMTPSAEDMAAVKYSVRFDYDKTVVKEFSENEIIGPGFSSVTSSKLKHDQTVYVTHNNREFQGVVRYHRPNIDQVIIQLVSPSSSALHIYIQEHKKLSWFDLMCIILHSGT